MHVQGDIGILLDKLLDYRGQGIARLRMGGRNRQTALLLVTKLLSDLLDTLDFAKNLSCRPQYRLARRGNTR